MYSTLWGSLGKSGMVKDVILAKKNYLVHAELHNKCIFEYMCVM